jgi:hypothetical protein
VFELTLVMKEFLSFEGAGAISQWRIELPQEFRLFDYDTISDVILHLRYTAREGGKALRDAAVNQLQEAVNTLAEDGILLSRLFSARHEFPGEWHRFLNPATGETHVLELDLNQDRFPYMFKDKVITLNTAQIFLKLKKKDDYKDEQPLFFNLKKEGGSEVKGVGLKIVGSPVDGLPYEPFKLNKNLGKWSIVLNEEYYIADDETHIDPNLSLGLAQK